jgi:hypothetical protein
MSELMASLVGPSVLLTQLRLVAGASLGAPVAKMVRS